MPLCKPDPSPLKTRGEAFSFEKIVGVWFDMDKSLVKYHYREG
jgi:hypothetical protein